MKKRMQTLLLIVLSTMVMLSAGCTKNAALGLYNSVLMNIGDKTLTDSSRLAGRREFGSDTYVGTYSADVEDASFEEYLFGNTSIEREGGYKLSICADFALTAGSCTLLLERDGTDPEVLFEGSGTFAGEVEFGPGSAYFLLRADGATGTIDVEIV